jgi:predicted ferric reductase
LKFRLLFGKAGGSGSQWIYGCLSEISDLMTGRGRYRWRSAIGWLLVFAGIASLPLMLASIDARPGRGWLTELGVGFGLVGLGLMVVQTWTSGRQTWVGRNFGADNLMHFHRHLGLFAVVMVLAHPLALFISDPDYLRFLDPRVDWMRSVALWVLLGALVLTAISSYFRERMGLSYELWRLIHGLLALCILGLALGHTLMVGHHLSTL